MRHIATLALVITACGSPATQNTLGELAAPTCGMQGQPCCAVHNGDPRSACSLTQWAAWPSGVYCISGTCQAWECPTPGFCSGIVAPGCAPVPGDAETCASCGGPGQPCCSDGWCDASTYCRSDGTCQDRCGGFGNPCCPAPSAAGDPPAGCRGFTACASDGTCTDLCGQAGQPCCANAPICAAGLGCKSGSCG